MIHILTLIIGFLLISTSYFLGNLILDSFKLPIIERLFGIILGLLLLVLIVLIVVLLYFFSKFIILHFF